MKKYEPVEIKSEEVSDLLSTPPPKIIRVGITTIFCIIILILTASLLIDYPESFSTKAVVISENPPVYLTSNTTGKLLHININNSGFIEQNGVVGILESTASYDHVLQLSSLLDTIKYLNCLSCSIDSIHLPELELGEVTPFYLKLVNAINGYRIYLFSDFKQKEIMGFRNQIKNYTSVLDIQMKQQQLHSSELGLIENDYKRFVILKDSGAISLSDFELKKKEYLISQRNYESNSISISNSKLAIAKTEREIIRLELESFEEVQKLESDIKNSIELLSVQISNWKNNYLIVSPIRGQVQTLNVWKENQIIRANEHLFVVTPENSTSYFSKIEIPGSHIGHISIGQPIQLEIEGYPEFEYGVLTGQVSNISEVPIEGNYLVYVKLPNNLVTHTNKQIPERPLYNANARVTTRHQKIFYKILQRLTSAN